MINGRLARGRERVLLKVLANLVEINIGRSGRAATDQEHLGVDHVGDKRQGAAKVVGHGVGCGQRQLVALAAGPVSSMG